MCQPHAELTEDSATLGLLLLDAEIARQFYHGTAIRQPWSDLPQASSIASFAAGSAEAWGDIVSKEQQVNGSLTKSTNAYGPTIVRDSSVSNALPDIQTDLGLYVLLQRIGSMATEGSVDEVQASKRARDCRSLLISWFKKFHSSEAFTVQKSSIMMLWHSIFMTLSSDLQTLEYASGSEGINIANRTHEMAQSWAKSPETRGCVIHAMLVQRQFKRIPLGTEPPIHAAACLYHCGIVLYCYARFGDGGTVSPNEHIEMPELDLLSLDGHRIMREEVGSRMVRGRQMEMLVLKIVNLLQRNSHWKVADRFAATLLALIGEGQDFC